MMNTYSCKGAKPNLASVVFNAPTRALGEKTTIFPLKTTHNHGLFAVTPTYSGVLQATGRRSCDPNKACGSSTPYEQTGTLPPTLENYESALPLEPHSLFHILLFFRFTLIQNEFQYGCREKNYYSWQRH